ncbi:MAG: hypothetical protein DWQ36_08245 [Acidobacteria bacterium]|nr:MAG: hypothetical protein DWQ30_01970 [Acidobacteriota bacterium]REK08798.1 MAG: hypothetical protein DWQ36_08245 [Acidobacteriota bacterium]
MLPTLRWAKTGVLVAIVSLAVGLAVGVASAAPEERVAFNTESKKYHCLSCQWAIRCTRNCIEVTASEARRRGGVACKVCGGSCRREPAADSAPRREPQPFRPYLLSASRQSSAADGAWPGRG